MRANPWESPLSEDGVAAVGGCVAERGINKRVPRDPTTTPINSIQTVKRAETKPLITTLLASSDNKPNV
ncbi:MAG TPA: hypothetical protein VE955_12125 [Candidatus Dormibacteraeota bacterium]|jgi:hypothetical protein|nr:hypothetical protein [Candidatus Dormibacteraeota bacterium]